MANDMKLLDDLAKIQISLANINNAINRLDDKKVKTEIQEKFFALVEYIDGAIEKLEPK